MHGALKIFYGLSDCNLNLFYKLSDTMVEIFKKVKFKKFFKLVQKRAFKPLFLSSIISFFLFFACKNLYLAFINLKKSFISPNLIIEYENLTDINYSEDLTAWVRENLNFQNLETENFENLYKNLKANFNFINKLEIDFSRYDFSFIKLTALSPIFLINDSFVLTSKKRLFNANLFKENCLNRLRKLYVPFDLKDEKLDKDFYDFINSIPSKIFSNYELHYKNECLIILKSKNLTNSHKLIVDKDSIFEDQKFNLIDNVLSKVLDMNKFKKSVQANKKLELLLDLRFRKRIIVRSSEDFNL